MFHLERCLDEDLIIEVCTWKFMFITLARKSRYFITAVTCLSSPSNNSNFSLHDKMLRQKTTVNIILILTILVKIRVKNSIWSLLWVGKVLETIFISFWPRRHLDLNILDGQSYPNLNNFFFFFNLFEQMKETSLNRNLRYKL